MTVRFDGYTATTTTATKDDVFGVLMQSRYAGDKIVSGKGFFGFSERWGIQDDTGSQFGYVAFGGRQGSRVMIEVKGERTPEVVERLRRDFPHNCTRVDSCADFDAPGAFEGLLGHVMQIKRDYKLYGDRAGDWDYPELGRTQYLGSKVSTVRARLYEKGKQPEYRHLDKPNWTRLELQVRPVKAAKEAYSSLDAAEVWGASKWTRELAGHALQQHIDPHPPGTVYKVTERDAALSWMVKQYGPHLTSLAHDLGGWDVMGLTLREMHQENRRKGH